MSFAIPSRLATIPTARDETLAGVLKREVSQMIRGSCLCGQIRYELDGGVELINNCHCSMCRKAHGSAFGSFLHASSEGFRWSVGEDLIEQYRSSPGNIRAFCRVCGSRMPVLEDGQHVNIPAGTLDGDPGVRPVVNIFVSSKASWFEIEDSLPRFSEFPPQEFWESVMAARES